MKAIRFINMKPCCRILLPSKNTPFLGVPFLKSPNYLPTPNYLSNFKFPSHKIHTSNGLGFRSILSRTQKPKSVFTSNWGQSRVFSTTCCCNFNPSAHYLVPRVIPNVRDFSTSVETRVNDKNFERIYVQGGLNVKPVVVEKIDLDENIVKKEDNEVEGADTVCAVKENVSLKESVKVDKEESEVEKEAWRLLRKAVVSYCGSPVGTLAANDPNDKLPLNYDQVFIRDFVPSAFAFLLKGEGDIVRNFLLHTLQLQVICFLEFFRCMPFCCYICVVFGCFRCV